MNDAIVKECWHAFIDHYFPGGPLQTEYGWNFIYHMLSEVCLNRISGDVVEIGCNSGGTSVFLQLILDYHESQKPLWLYDSFQGMSEWSKQDDGSTSQVEPGQLAFDEAFVRQQFTSRGLRMPNIRAGWVADTLPQDLPSSIAFAYLDTDLYAPIKHSLECVYSRVTPGGIIMVDDYNCPFILGAKKATDEFFADKPEKPQQVWRCHAVYVRKQ